MYTRVVVPLDGSRPAEGILPFIVQIAAPLDLEVVLTVKAEAEAPCHGAGLTGGCSWLQAARMTLRATEPRQIQKRV